MVLSADEIIPEIRSGRCRKASIPGFDNASYFADPEGNIYSLNNPREPKTLDQKLGNGLMWVTLFEKEGFIRKVMVGDVIANTFLSEVERDASESTVIYCDGDSRNNAASNLKWGTPQEQQSMLRKRQLENTGKGQNEFDKESGEKEESKDSVLPFIPKREEDPLLEQLHLLQSRLEKAQGREKELLEALGPFARFELSPAQATDVGGTVVIESNRGSNIYSRLTVQDFRVARTTFEGGEKEQANGTDAKTL
jgi:hypothetical protein